MPQALKPLSLINIWSWENSHFPLLALWGNKNGLPSMKVKKLENTKNIRSLRGCKWSSLNVPGTENPLSHSLLGLEESPFPIRGDVQMTSALRGREGVSQILTKGREVAWIWYWQGEGGGKKSRKFRRRHMYMPPNGNYWPCFVKTRRIMGDYCAPGRGVTEIIPPEGPIMPPRGLHYAARVMPSTSGQGITTVFITRLPHDCLCHPTAGCPLI